jgi:hypothetical protein
MSDLSHASNSVLEPASNTAPRRGPRTARRKAHSARNALRHGLNVPVAADPATVAAVEALINGLDRGRSEMHVLEREELHRGRYRVLVS